MPQKMKILAMAIASTFNSQRKYLRWHLKVCSFFGAVIRIVLSQRNLKRLQTNKPWNLEYLVLTNDKTWMLHSKY